jgi:putative ABC transport system substrate-binding protein
VIEAATALGDRVVNRRAFITGTLGLLAAPLTVEAQGGKVWRIGFLGAETASTNRHFLEAFRLGMREHGYVEGQNLTIEERWAEGRSERFRDLTVELIQFKVDVLVPISTPAVVAAKDLTGTIPIVFIAVDPLGTGLVSSLARPGGNVTGLSITLGDEFAGKWLELLGEAVPRLSRVAIVWNPANPSNASFLKAVQVAAQKLGTKLELQSVGDPSQLASAFGAVLAAKAQALIVFPDPLTVRYRARIVDLAAESRLPAIYGSGSSRTWGDSWPTGRALPRSVAAPLPMSTRSSRVPNRASFPSNRPRSSSW